MNTTKSPSRTRRETETNWWARVSCIHTRALERKECAAEGDGESESNTRLRCWYCYADMWFITSLVERTRRSTRVTRSLWCYWNEPIFEEEKTTTQRSAHESMYHTRHVLLLFNNRLIVINKTTQRTNKRTNEYPNNNNKKSKYTTYTNTYYIACIANTTDKTSERQAWRENNSEAIIQEKVSSDIVIVVRIRTYVWFRWERVKWEVRNEKRANYSLLLCSRCKGIW